MKLALSTAQSATTKVKILPKIDLLSVLSEEVLLSIAGKLGVTLFHTDGTKCDTTSGCNC